MIIQRKGNRHVIIATIRMVFETELKTLSPAVSFETALGNQLTILFSLFCRISKMKYGQICRAGIHSSFEGPTLNQFIPKGKGIDGMIRAEV